MATLALTEPYVCYIKAVETVHSTKESKKFSFVIDFIEVSDEEDKKMIAIPSMHSYDSYHDAIQDAYGIIELYGFRLNEGIPRARIEIMEWDEDKDKYIPHYTYFDGRDFFPEEENK